jgi:hypothetical protein
VKTLVVAGKTQLGKSAVKGMINVVGQEFKVPVIIITKGVKESRELHEKLQEYASPGSKSSIVSISAGGRTKHSREKKKQEIQDAMENGGTLVLADTSTQIGKAIAAIETYRNKEKPPQKIILVVDECDAMYRTPDRIQKGEEAYDKLMEMGPIFVVQISATVIPLLLILREENVQGVEMYSIEPADDYLGIEQMQLLRGDAGGNDTFLEHRELSPNCPIPYTNEKVMMLYDNALSRTNTKGVLLLDCTDPRVYAYGNVIEKAEKVQNLFLKEKNKPIVVIAYIGKGIQVRLPGETWVPHTEGLSNVIDSIDDDIEYGLDTPVFVFGFSKMRRGISYRSSRRVPTHYAILLGVGHSHENTIQSHGRATFRGKGSLQENGFEYVTVFGSSSDLEMAQKYQQFTLAVQERLNAGASLEVALGHVKQKYPDSENYFRHTNWKIGQWAGKRLSVLMKHDVFEEPDGKDKSTQRLKVKYWDQDNAQQIMLVLSEVTHNANNAAKKPRFFVEDIVDAFNDTFRDSCISTNKTAMNTLLIKFRDDGLIQELKDEPRKNKGGKWIDTKA